MSQLHPRSTHRRPWAALGVVVAGLAVTLVPGVAAAQDASPAPGPVTVQVTPVGPDAQGGTIIVGQGTIGVGPDVVQLAPGGCVAAQTVTVGADGQAAVPTTGAIRLEAGMGSSPAQVGEISAACGEAGVMFGAAMPSSVTVVSGQAGMGCGAAELGDVTVVSGEAAMACGPAELSGGVMQAGPAPFGVPGGPGSVGMSGTVTVMAEPAHLVTVTAVDGPTVSLKTDDGWTRDLDTTNVAITLDTDTLTAADLAAGDEVLVVQVRNANDTYTVTGLQLILPEAMGVVSDVTADGFTVTAMDGTTTAVRVSDATTWPATMPGGPATGPSALTDGDMVVARGKLAEDGSMDAASVAVMATITVSTGDAGMMVPPPVVTPNPTPEASPKG
jgi:hypothetical protein